MKKITVLLCCLCASPLWAGVRGDLRQGGRLYNAQKYGQALETYQKILQKNPQNPTASFGAGASSYYLKDYNAAAAAFEQVAQSEDKLQQDALFNLGNTFYRANDKEKAIAAYKKAILNNPGDKDAIHNLQLLLKNEQNQSNQNNQNNQNQNKNSSNQENKDQSDNQGQSPQQQEQNQQSKQQPNQMNQEDSERILQMARDNEYKAPSNPNQSGQNGGSSVEKDW